MPKLIAPLLLVFLSLQIGFRASSTVLPPTPNIPPAMESNALSLFSLGDPVACAKWLLLWLQTFESHSGKSIPLSKLDYPRLIAWLDTVMRLDKKATAPLIAASHIYSLSQDKDQQKQMLDFIAAKFVENPAERWPAMLQAIYVARFIRKDQALALSYAKTLHSTLDGLPHNPTLDKKSDLFLLEPINA